MTEPDRNTEIASATAVNRALAACRRRLRAADAARSALEGLTAGLSLAAWLLMMTALPAAARWVLWTGGVLAVVLVCTRLRALRDAGLWAWLPIASAAVGLAVVLAANLLPTGLDSATRGWISLALVVAAAGSWMTVALVKSHSLRQVALFLDRHAGSQEQWLTAVELADADDHPFRELQRRRLLEGRAADGKRVRFFVIERGLIGLLLVAACATVLFALLPAHRTEAQAEQVRLGREREQTTAAVARISTSAERLLPTQHLVQSILAWQKADSSEADIRRRRIATRELTERLEDHLRALQSLQRAGRAVADVLGEYDATVDLAILIGKPDRLEDARDRIRRLAERIDGREELPSAERDQWLKALREAAGKTEGCIPLWRALTSAADALEAGDGSRFSRQMDRIVTALARAEREKTDTQLALEELGKIGRPRQTQPTAIAATTRNGATTPENGGPIPAAATRTAAAPQRVFAGDGNGTSRPATAKVRPRLADPKFEPLADAMRRNTPPADWLGRLDLPTRRMVRRYFSADNTEDMEPTR